MEELKELILKALQRRSGLTTEEVIKEVEAEVPEATPSEVREALLQLLKDGKIEKVPEPSKMKFIFRIK
ncbi:MAG: hypothetical protein DRO10_02070 [Thermoprotei archaeon]|nr:MAG: hypothetical protein DRO10_02070 [Thermoprotei archaeon]